MKCIVCCGTGEMPKVKIPLKEKEKIALKLRKQGIPYRIIIETLGYKSPRSIQKIENKYDKRK